MECFATRNRKFESFMYLHRIMYARYENLPHQKTRWFYAINPYFLEVYNEYLRLWPNEKSCLEEEMNESIQCNYRL